VTLLCFSARHLPTLPTTASCFAEQVLLHPEFSAEVQFPSSFCGTVCSATPKFRDSSQVSEDSLSLFVSSLFENSSAPFQQGATEQVQVSKDIVSDFVTSLFEHSCLLITQESTNRVKFTAADTFLSSPKFLPGVPPEGVSVESDEGIGRESVGGHASVSDSYPHSDLPPLSSPTYFLFEERGDL